MSRYREGIWSGATYWKPTVYATALIWIRNGSITGINFTNATNPSKVQQRIADLRSDYRYSYNRSSDAIAISGEVYNQLLQTLDAGNNPGTIQEIANGGLKVAELKDKNVYGVWNKTDASFIRGFETEAEALKGAEEQARKNPTKAYLIMAPKSVVYQPVSIKVESVG